MPPKPGCCRDWKNPNQPAAKKKLDEGSDGREVVLAHLFLRNERRAAGYCPCRES
jgi:hypothetical protein